VGAIQERTLYPINISGRSPQTSDYLVVSKMDLDVGIVRLVTCTMLCSFVLQTLRCSVRSFYKLYDALFVRSTNFTMLCSFVLQTLRCSVRLLNKNERLFRTFDLQNTHQKSSGQMLFVRSEKQNC